MAKKSKNPVWYLAGPFYQYTENVKELAERAGLRIIDATVTADRTDEADKVPKVTLRDEFKPKAADKGKAKAEDKAADGADAAKE